MSAQQLAVKVYSAGGSCGDIIAMLPALKDQWQQSGIVSELYLNRNCDPHWRQSEATLRSLLTLIERQPYVVRSGLCTDYVGHNLDDTLRHPWQNGTNLADTISGRLGLPHTSRTEPWLYNVEPCRVARVVFHRSPRYNTPWFPWHRIADRYRDEAVFIGGADEHACFVRQFGSISYWRTRTFLELAQVIQGAVLFAGNQSSPSWIAEGLRKPKLAELVGRDEWCWNCHWERPLFWDHPGDPLPDLDQLESLA